MEKTSRHRSDSHQWSWRQRYRVWEANRRVFLYPENWIEPEMRDDKSSFFQALENELSADAASNAPPSSSSCFVLVACCHVPDVIPIQTPATLDVLLDLIRTRYFSDHLLTAATLQEEQEYFRHSICRNGGVVVGRPGTSYFFGKLLTAAGFWEEQAYSRDGPRGQRGVVIGLPVTESADPALSLRRPPTAVSPYLDELIAWGDLLFRSDQIEGIDEVTTAYITAARILGPRLTDRCADARPVPPLDVTMCVADLYVSSSCGPEVS